MAQEPGGTEHEAVRWTLWRPRGAGHLDRRRLLGFLGAHAVPGIESWDGVTYSSVLPGSVLPGSVLPGESGDGSQGWALARIRATASGFVVRIGLPAELASGLPGVLARARARLRHLLALDQPWQGERHLAADPYLGPLLAARPGLTLPGCTDPAQVLIRTVIGQQVSVAAARTVTARVVASLGVRLPDAVATATGLTHHWPTAEAFAGADDATLPMPRARARAVVGVAGAMAEGRLVWPRSAAIDPQGVVDLSDSLRHSLLALPGVGPWTADYTLLRVLRHPDVFLPADLAVRRQLAALGGPDDPAKIDRLAQSWRPHRSTALAQLWAAYLAR